MRLDAPRLHRLERHELSGEIVSQIFERVLQPRTASLSDRLRSVRKSQHMDPAGHAHC